MDSPPEAKHIKNIINPNTVKIKLSSNVTRKVDATKCVAIYRKIRELERKLVSGQLGQCEVSFSAALAHNWPS